MAGPQAWLRAGVQSGSILTFADIATQLFVEGNHLGSSRRDKVPTAASLGSKVEERLRSNADKGDIVANGNAYDPIRTARWTTVGLFLHGPYFFSAFSDLDRRFGAGRTLGNVLKKTAVAQFVVFPPYLVVLFTFMGFAEGMMSTGVVEKVRTHVPEAFVTGCVFWPIVNVVNFALVGPSFRLPYIAAVGGVWNGFLSWSNGRNSDVSDTDRCGK